MIDYELMMVNKLVENKKGMNDYELMMVNMFFN